MRRCHCEVAANAASIDFCFFMGFCNVIARSLRRSNPKKETKITMNKQSYYVYIMTNTENGTLYTGVTNDLVRRVYEHKNKLFDGFTKKYELNKLVYYKVYDNIETAIAREKQLKGGSRKRKLDLINKFNKQWEDLYEKII